MMSENNKNCGLARDLMPLAIDNVCSDNSRKFLEEHLENCDACRDAYARMKTPAPVQETAESEEAASEQEQKALAKSVKKTAKRMKIRRWLIVLMIPVLIWACLFGFSQYSQYRYKAKKPLSLQHCDTKLSTYGQYLFMDLSIYNAPGAYRGTEVHFDISTVDTEQGPVRAAVVTLYPQVSPYIQWNYDSYYVYSHDINHADPVFCYIDGGVYTINSMNHVHSQNDADTPADCSFAVGVPVAMISITDGEYYEVLYTWGDQLPEKNMEMLSTTNPYDAWNDISAAKVLNPSMLLSTNVEIPLYGGGTYAGMDAAPIQLVHVTPVPMTTLPPTAVVASPQSKAQEVAQFRALQPTQAPTEDPSPTQTPPAKDSENTPQ